MKNCMLKMFLAVLVVGWCAGATANEGQRLLLSVEKEGSSEYLLAKRKKRKKKRKKRKKTRKNKQVQRKEQGVNDASYTVVPVKLAHENYSSYQIQSTSTDAQKQDRFSGADYPREKIERPLVLPPMLLETEVGFQLDTIDPVDDMMAVRLVGSLGLANGLELGVSLPVLVSPSFDLGDFRLFGMFDLGDVLGNSVQSAIRVTLAVPVALDDMQWSSTDFVAMVDTPIRYYLSQSWALVGDARLGYAAGGTNLALVFMDIGIAYQANHELALAGILGIHTWLGDKSHVVVPLKARGTYTVLKNLDMLLDVGYFDSSEFGGNFFQVLFGAAMRFQL